MIFHELLQMALLISSFFLVPSPPVNIHPSQSPETVPMADTLATFRNDVAPLLKANCTPCHFPGGKMYQEYPFDNYATVHRLRNRLGTRLNKPGQQAVLARWIDSGAKEK